MLDDQHEDKEQIVSVATANLNASKKDESVDGKIKTSSIRNYKYM